jgi:hypothetical protein
MCDYSLEAVRSRPAKIGDKLTTQAFDSGIMGFAAPEDSRVVVCVPPGAELVFDEDIQISTLWWQAKSVGHKTAIFRQINKIVRYTSHDALEFPDGGVVLLTKLCAGQRATVLQVPAPRAADIKQADIKQRAHRPFEASSERNVHPASPARGWR